MDNPERRPIVQHMTDTDVIIVGGGLNGPVLALALAQAGQRVTVIDALSEPLRADPEFDGRAYALALTSQRLLDALGLWEHLQDQAQPMLEIKVTDGRAILADDLASALAALRDMGSATAALRSCSEGAACGA